MAPTASHIFIEQAYQLLSLGNYTPPVINCGCKNKGINKSYRRTFRIYSKVTFFKTLIHL
jgi:hypothetical protein